MDAMKNLYVRLTVIGCVVAMGVGAIYQTLGSSNESPEQETKTEENILPGDMNSPGLKTLEVVPIATNEIDRVKSGVELALHEDHENPSMPIIRGNNEDNTEETKPAQPPSSFRFSAPVGSATSSTPTPTSSSTPVSRFATSPSSNPAASGGTTTPSTESSTTPKPSTRFSTPIVAPVPKPNIGGTAAANRFSIGDTNTPTPAAGNPASESTGLVDTSVTPVVTPTPASTPTPSARFSAGVSSAATPAPVSTTTPTLPSSPPAPISSFTTTPQPTTPAPSTPDAGVPSPRFNIGDNSPTAPVASPVSPQYNANPIASVASRAPTMVQGSGQPGKPDLEGVQSPSLTLEKIAPQEIQVGKKTTFELRLKNVGPVAAQQVMIRDSVPQGTRLVDTVPQAQQLSSGTLIWELGTIAPGEEQTIKMDVIPEIEGDVGSVASVSFSAEATAKSRVTKPELMIEQSAPGSVLIGNQISIAITLSNPGTGPATGVILEEVVPTQFSHPAGSDLEFEIGTLKPGESRQLNLVLNAEKAGFVSNVIGVRGDGNLATQSKIDVQVIAPELQVSMVGPKLRYLERPAKYTVSVTNPGTAPAQEIDLVTYLPKGLQFVEANNAGQYDSTKHAVYWNLAELPPAQSGSVELVALPVEAGDQKLRVEGSASMGLEAQHESSVKVEGLAAIFFEVVDQADPIEVGKDTEYEVKVVNQGSKTATNIKVVAVLPPGMQGLDASGATQGQVTPQQITFAPLARLAPKADAVFKIKAKGLSAGDQRIKVLVSSDDFLQPITEEESTRVYADK